MAVYKIGRVSSALALHMLIINLRNQYQTRLFTRLELK